MRGVQLLNVKTPLCKIMNPVRMSQTLLVLLSACHLQSAAAPCVLIIIFSFTIECIY